MVALRYAIHINRFPATGQIAPGPVHLSECHCGAHGPGGFGLLPPVSRFPRGRRNRAGDMGLFRRLAASLSANGAVRSASSTPGSAPRCRASAGATAACIHTGAAVIRSPLPCPVAAHRTRFRIFYRRTPAAQSPVATTGQDTRNIVPPRTGRARGALTRLLVAAGGRSNQTRPLVCEAEDRSAEPTAGLHETRGTREPRGQQRRMDRHEERDMDMAGKMGRVDMQGASGSKDAGNVRSVGLGEHPFSGGAKQKPGRHETAQGTRNDRSHTPASACWHRALSARLRTLAGIALLSFTAFCIAGTARADVLVSNTGETRTNSGSNVFLAQSFETGANVGGYTITNVQIRLTSRSSGTTSVKIREDNSGAPGDVVQTLTNPTLTPDALNTFTAPSDTTLEGSTTYWISVNEGISSRASYASTEGYGQTGATGWSIGNGVSWRSNEGQVWSTSTISLVMVINGSARSNTAPNVPSLPEVSIYALTPSVREGEQANFTLLRTGGGPRGALTVAVLVESESGVLSTSTPPTRATIRAGHGIASLLLPTAEEGVDGRAGKAVKVTLVADTADPPTYTLRSPASATVTVTDSGAPAGVPRVAGPPAVGTREAGGDGLWNEGETVRVTFTFSEAVVVSSWIGRPLVEIGFDRPAATRTARYLRGSRTKELVFGYTLVAGDTLVVGGAHHGTHRGRGVITIAPDSLALNGSAIRSMATRADAWLGHRGTVQHTFSLRGGRQGPGARFEGVPASHDESGAFTVELHFNAEPEGLSFRTVAGGLLEVEGGTVTRAARSTPGSNLGWRVTVAPSGAGDVRIRLPARPCGSPNAVCIGGRPLAQAAEATVPGTSSTEPPPEVPLTASFSNVPAEHDGTSPFELRFRLSAAPAGLSYRTVRNGLFNVSGGTIGRARRLQKGNNEGWGIRVEPSGFGDVTLTVRATTDCAGTPGVCTSDGRKLGGGLQATIAGPATLSVADAEVDEDSGAVLDFTVTLSRRLMETVTVEYGTADGSASAGADYTNTSGTLTFAVGETSKTVAVPVLDDELDEGSETLTLTLSNPAPARVKLADAEATGTINNNGAMPKAWIARFGRTVAEHVLDAVEARREAGAKPFNIPYLYR